MASSVSTSNDPSVLILTSLSSGPKHGYALTKDIEGFAGVRLGPGTMYGAITRHEQRGLIEALEAQNKALLGGSAVAARFFNAVAQVGEDAVEAGARRFAITERTFARRFRAETGTTPYAWSLAIGSGIRPGGSRERLRSRTAPPALVSPAVARAIRG